MIAATIMIACHCGSADRCPNGKSTSSGERCKIEVNLTRAVAQTQVALIGSLMAEVARRRLGASAIDELTAEAANEIWAALTAGTGALTDWTPARSLEQMLDKPVSP